MTGSTEAPRDRRPTPFAAVVGTQRRYVAVDGGSGAHLLADLAGRNPRLQPVPSARHADLLIVVEPVAAKLVPALREVARALPRPAYALSIGAPRDLFPEADLADVAELLPGATRVPRAEPNAVVAAALDATRLAPLQVAEHAAPGPTPIALPAKDQRELATELAVLSLGPLQPVTAGPLRILLVCEGEQVLQAQIEAGYARRGVATAMAQAGWEAAAGLAEQLDPLAPVAGRLAYVRAIEQLQGISPRVTVVAWRESMLALERAQNSLWWLLRFLHWLGVEELAERTYRLAGELAGAAQAACQEPMVMWLAPQAGVPPINQAAVVQLRSCAAAALGLDAYIRRDRFIRSRLHNVGPLAVRGLRGARVSGPVLQASERGVGDAQGRLWTRLAAIAADLGDAAARLARMGPAEPHAVRWEVPSGEATAAVDGPRGRIGLRLASEGGERPATVEWQRPSAALVGMLPEILAGQKLADAELVVASLDLAMAEADG